MTPYSLESYQDYMMIAGRVNPGMLPVSDDAAFPTNFGDDDGFFLKFDIESYLENFDESGTISSSLGSFVIFTSLGIISIILTKLKSKPVKLFQK
jgi:hypothetical protein